MSMSELCGKQKSVKNLISRTRGVGGAVGGWREDLGKLSLVSGGAWFENIWKPLPVRAKYRLLKFLMSFWGNLFSLSVSLSPCLREWVEQSGRKCKRQLCFTPLIKVMWYLHSIFSLTCEHIRRSRARFSFHSARRSQVLISAAWLIWDSLLWLRSN